MIIITNIIIDGGIPSKNYPNYSESSFLLACKNKNISGFKIDIYVTKDAKFVLANKNILNEIGINEKFIHNNDYKKIKNINYGTKVKSHYLINIDTLLKMSNQNLYILINICNDYLTEKEINSLNEILTSYNSKKLLVYSHSRTILEKISNKLNKGIFISNKKDWEYTYMFYVVKEKDIDIKNIMEKVKNNEKVFIICKKNSNIETSLNNKNIFIILEYSSFILKSHIE